jgi:hypothetical protein
MREQYEQRERLSRGTLFGVRSAPLSETGPHGVTGANSGAGDSLGPLTFQGLPAHPADGGSPLRDALRHRDTRLTTRDVGATAVGPTGPKDGTRRVRSPIGLSPAGRVPVTPDAASGLEHNAKIASQRGQARRERMRLRAQLRGFTTLARVAKCGRCRCSDSGVTLVQRPDGGAHYRGLTTCGSVWLCPVCAAKVQHKRAAELAAAIRAHQARGGSVVFLTLTARHGAGDDLGHLHRSVTRGYSSLWTGRGRLSAGLPIVGHIRALEVTHGANGWHPHIHALVFVDGVMTPDDVAALQGLAFGRWRDSLVRDGYGAPLAEHCRAELVRPDTAGLSQYLTKIGSTSAGYEVASNVTKKARAGQRSSWQLLQDAADGDADALTLWATFEAGMKGARQLQWSRGLRAKLALAPARSDEEIAADDVAPDAVPIVTLSPMHWQAVRKMLGLDATLLDAAERGGADAVREAMALAGIRLSSDPPS